ncbi:hypothetical protein EUTSA_v10023246mg [Eutrema salsugineum]|uniref:Uncharacterized protein n=1 Tax=Eutrema salsugineum TaxID=72664 RepID=V4KDE0_EUTSA|nr:putative disease resistance protein At1g63350 [Eutrema salsugineum]ESQ29134.1 hypothetical protein EUTSA_v10023246mg [Eutrema salsugineum]
MGNCFSTTVEFWTTRINLWLVDNGGYTHNLEKNLTALEKTMEDLKAKRDTLLGRVKREEDRGLQRSAEIKVWLTRVETIEKNVNELLSARNNELERLYLCGLCSNDLITSNLYGEAVFSTLRDGEELKCSGVFDVIADQPQTSEVVQRQLQPTIVGQEIMLDEAWEHLRKDGVGIMGLYGMGGVGKTTLLEQINNKFSEERCGFDFVIWVVVSKELHVEKIQDEVARKVDLGGGEWKEKEKTQKADVLFTFLKKKKFVLFLDDIWEKVELKEIGIPFPTAQNGCKLAFTTRSQDVCAHMGVKDPMEVQCLEENKAFDLFQKKVGPITLGSDPDIPDLARKVAKKCCGLPLALNVVGETMSCKRTVQEWRHAIDVLTSYAVEFSGMEDKILPLLKYSYDNLKGEQVKSCLLYCALFPEDAVIPNKKLIDYWIGEGIIDGSECVEKAENEGYGIISSLVRASLLRECRIRDPTVRMHDADRAHPASLLMEVQVIEYAVRMHDVVREMALWIASDLGKQKEAFIVRAGVGLREIPKVKNWKIVRKMSLMKNQIHHLAGSAECFELTTLLLQDTSLAKISSGFFNSMPKLVVLDLSDNRALSELPEGISKLVSLQYLNLSWTAITHLCTGLLQLIKLIHLDLRETYELSSIAGISSLHNLKVLKLLHSAFLWDLDAVKELESLEHLEIFDARLELSQGFQQFLSSHRITSCTRSVEFRPCGDGLHSSEISLPVTMDKLCDFRIEDCSISEIKMVNIETKTVSPLHNPRSPRFSCLSKVDIKSCKYLRELTFLMFAPNLKSLYLNNLPELEDIINKEKACEGKESKIVPFRKLLFLWLCDLPELKNIYWSPLLLPCLEKISVYNCPSLKKLPLNSQSGPHGEYGLIIEYIEFKWFDGLEWEDEATKTRFVHLSKPLKGIYESRR